RNIGIVHKHGGQSEEWGGRFFINQEAINLTQLGWKTGIRAGNYSTQGSRIEGLNNKGFPIRFGNNREWSPRIHDGHALRTPTAVVTELHLRKTPSPKNRMSHLEGFQIKRARKFELNLYRRGSPVLQTDEGSHASESSSLLGVRRWSKLFHEPELFDGR